MKRLSFLFLLAFGCGSPSVQEVDDLIQQMASEQCAWEFHCCTDPEIKQLDGTKFSTLATCTPYRALAMQTELYLHRLAAREGRLKVDTSVSAACLSQLQGRACNPNSGTPTSSDPMDVGACAKVFVGTTKIGEECIYSTECETGSHCVSDAAAVGRGVCVPFQKESEICNIDADCDPTVKGLYCAKGDFRCHLPAALGAPCAYTTDVSGKTATLPLLYRCDSTFFSTYCDPVTSACKTLPVDGEACLSPLPPGVASACNPDKALGIVCDRGTGTSSSGGTCRSPATVGESCQSLSCAENLYCDTSLSAYKCKALPGLGQSCSAANYRCSEPYFCNTSVSPYVCDQPAAIGQSCTSPSRSCTIDAYCDSSGSHACAPRRSDGATCESSTQCLSNSCGFPTGGSGDTTVCLAHTTGVACVGH